MKNVYIYVLETMADWETGNLLAELNTRRFFKKDAPSIDLVYVNNTLKTITTMGGMTASPQATIDDIVISPDTMLVLPGADTWQDPNNNSVIQKALEIIKVGGCVAAICGATVALANTGVLDEVTHTSNGPGFLEMFSPNYKGSNWYADEPATKTNSVITASATGSLLWTKYIIEHLGVFSDTALESWYQYFSTGSVQHFYGLISEFAAPSDIEPR